MTTHFPSNSFLILSQETSILIRSEIKSLSHIVIWEPPGLESLREIIENADSQVLAPEILFPNQYSLIL